MPAPLQSINKQQYGYYAPASYDRLRQARYRSALQGLGAGGGIAGGYAAFKYGRRSGTLYDPPVPLPLLNTELQNISGTVQKVFQRFRKKTYSKYKKRCRQQRCCHC